MLHAKLVEYTRLPFALWEHDTRRKCHPCQCENPCNSRRRSLGNTCIDNTKTLILLLSILCLTRQFLWIYSVQMGRTPRAKFWELLLQVFAARYTSCHSITASRHWRTKAHTTRDVNEASKVWGFWSQGRGQIPQGRGRGQGWAWGQDQKKLWGRGQTLWGWGRGRGQRWHINYKHTYIHTSVLFQALGPYKPIIWIQLKKYCNNTYDSVNAIALPYVWQLTDNYGYTYYYFQTNTLSQMVAIHSWFTTKPT